MIILFKCCRLLNKPCVVPILSAPSNKQLKTFNFFGYIFCFGRGIGVMFCYFLDSESICIYYDSNQFKSRLVSTQETISIVHVYIKSARKNVTDFLCNLKCLNWKFNFIILSEIWGNPDTAKLNIIEGYSHVYNA